MSNVVNREELALAYWGSVVVGNATTAALCVVGSLLVLDMQLDLHVKIISVNRVSGPLLLIFLFWSEWLLAAVVRRSGAQFPIGSRVSCLLGLTYFLLFVFMWRFARSQFATYLDHLDSLYPTRSPGYSTERFDYASGLLCLYGHLFIRASLKLWCVVAACHGAQDAATTTAAQPGDSGTSGMKPDASTNEEEMRRGG